MSNPPSMTVEEAVAQIREHIADAERRQLNVTPMKVLLAAYEDAVADSRRIEWIERTERLACCWNVDGKQNNGWTINVKDDDGDDDFDNHAPAGKTWRDAVDWAMKLDAKAGERETT